MPEKKPPVKPPVKPPQKPPDLPAQMTSVISYLEQILEIVNEIKLISLANTQSLKDIDSELGAQGQAIQGLEKSVEGVEKSIEGLEESNQEILEILRGSFEPTTNSNLEQVKGVTRMGPYSIQAGSSGTFLRTDVPEGSGGLATGTTASYQVDNPNVTLGPDPLDPGNTDKVQASVLASETETSFTLSVTITPAADESGTAGADVTDNFTITITPGVGPVFTPTTGSDLTQTAGAGPVRGRAGAGRARPSPYPARPGAGRRTPI